MATTKRHEIQILDKTTGQVLDFLFLPPKGLGGKWVRIFQDGLLLLLKEHPELRGESLRVLLYLQTTVGWCNLLPMPPSVAETLRVSEPNIYRAYAQLGEAGFIWKHEGKYYLSPVIGWKGTEAQLQEAYQTVFLAMRDPALYGRVEPKTIVGERPQR